MLNQYGDRENNTVPFAGLAHAAATVAVQDQLSPAGRQGSFWSNELIVPNSSAPWTGTRTVYAARNGLIGSETRSVQIPAALQAFAYDYDGNLTSDGIWTYSWDAENRLASMVTTASAVAAGYPNRVIQFRYDHLNRRVEKVVRLGTTYQFLYGTRYVYDGWNLIAEYDMATGNIVRSYAWGLDTAGTLDATGGIGALVQITTYNSSGATKAM